VNEALVLRAERGPVVELTLNRPANRNALSRAMLGALSEALSEVGSSGARAIIVRGAGEHFCAGHDLRELAGLSEPAEYRAVFDDCVKLMSVILEVPQPVIAKVQGVATAAGCQLVAACDLAVASVSARFATPGVNIGLFCSTPMVALSRNVARKHAMEMLLTGDFVDAKRACEMGLVNRVVAEDELDAATQALAARVAEKSQAAVAIGKPAFYRQLELPVLEAYRYTAGVMARNMMDEDAREGIDAFLTKRKPSWGSGG
jgi:enoyl-CoA hydratase/carnithine racemase